MSDKLQPEELNRAIAKALGCRVDEYAGYLWCCCPSPGNTPHGRGPDNNLLLDYAHDLNATMAVIREKWPNALVQDDGRLCRIQTDRHTEYDSEYLQEVYVWSYPLIFGSGETDAERLARALLEGARGYGGTSCSR